MSLCFRVVLAQLPGCLFLARRGQAQEPQTARIRRQASQPQPGVVSVEKPGRARYRPLLLPNAHQIDTPSREPHQRQDQGGQRARITTALMARLAHSRGTSTPSPETMKKTGNTPSNARNVPTLRAERRRPASHAVVQPDQRAHRIGCPHHNQQDTQQNTHGSLVVEFDDISETAHWSEPHGSACDPPQSNLPRRRACQIDHTIRKKSRLSRSGW